MFIRAHSAFMVLATLIPLAAAPHGRALAQAATQPLAEPAIPSATQSIVLPTAAQSGAEDELSVLELVADYKERLDQFQLESRRELRKLKVETLRAMKAAQRELLRAEKVDDATQAAQAIERFKTEQFASELQLVSANGAPVPPDPFASPRPYRPVGLEPASAPPIPAVIAELLAKFAAGKLTIEGQLDSQLKKLGAEYIPQLKKIQAQLVSKDRLDGAVLAREATRVIMRRALAVFPDPGMVRATPQDIGKSYIYEIVAQPNGTPYGTDIYTTDSPLGATVIHAGVLKPGQRGLVKVTILPGQSQFVSSTRHGIRSNDWGPYPVSFKVEAVGEDPNQ